MQMQNENDNSPSFIGWKCDGAIRITVEGVGEHVDGETLFAFSQLTGVEAGPSKVLALNERPNIIVFKGKYDEQRECFDRGLC
jgi:hypothetical protein